MWVGFVDVLRATIFGAAHVCGGSLGTGIIVVSALVRIALLPLTLRLARRAREQQARLAAIATEIEALQRRHANDPGRMFGEIQALKRQHGIRLLTPSTAAGMAIQFPVLGALFSAVRKGLGAKVRYLWIADLARPDFTLLLGAAAASAWAFSATPSQPGQTASQTPALVLTLIMTVVIFWTSSAAVVLSVGSGSLVSVLQNWLVNRDAKARA